MAHKQKRSALHLVRHHARQTLVPHKGNQYTPHIIRRSGLLVVLVLVAALHFGSNFAASGDVLGQRATVEPRQLLAATNQVRRQKGEQPLAYNEQLARAAYLKGRDMLARDYWAHNAPDGAQPWKWLGDIGYNYAAAGENLARNFSNSGAVMAAWMASPEHRVNVLKAEYRDVGFAVLDGDLQGEPTTLVVAFYGAKTGQTGSVAGASNDFNQASSSFSPLSYVGLALQSLSPATLGALTLIIAASIVGLVTHAYREKLPRRLQQSWYRHHALYKTVGLLCLGTFIVVASASGQL